MFSNRLKTHISTTALKLKELKDFTTYIFIKCTAVNNCIITIEKSNFSCNSTITTTVNATVRSELALSPESSHLPISNLYELSYMFLGTAGFVATLTSGILISWATGFQKPDALRQDLFVQWLPCLAKRQMQEKGRPVTDRRSAIQLTIN